VLAGVSMIAWYQWLLAVPWGDGWVPFLECSMSYGWASFLCSMVGCLCWQIKEHCDGQ